MIRALLRALLRALPLALSALVGGCDNVPVTTVGFRIEDPWAIAQGAMPLPVVVLGRPFAHARDALVAETVVQTMAEAITWNRGARFVLVPEASVGSGLRIIVAFVRGKGEAGGGCAGAAAETAPSPVVTTTQAPATAGRIEMRAAFCDGDQLLADVHGRLGVSDGPADRRFRALVRQATGDLLRPPPAPRP